jgi:hypothetical protein
MRKEGGTYGGGFPMLLVMFLERFDGAVSGRSTTGSTIDQQSMRQDDLRDHFLRDLAISIRVAVTSHQREPQKLDVTH